MDKIEKLRIEITELLKTWEIIVDCTIYANGKRWIYGCKFSDDYEEMTVTEKVEDNIDVTEYLEYCNPESISIAFDGSQLYEILNYLGVTAGSYDEFIEQFNNLLERYGYYFDLGNSWNLSLYEI